MKTLQQALDTNDHEEIEKNIPLSEIKDFVDPNYTNAFLYACRFCSVRIITVIVKRLKEKEGLLLQQAEKLDKYKRSALMLAILNQDRQVLVYLVEGIAEEIEFKIDFKNEHNEKALTVAIKENCQEAFSYLIHQGAVFNHTELAILNAAASQKERDFKKYFYSPQCLLDMVCANSESSVVQIIRHVRHEKLPIARKNIYFQIRNADEQHILLLAAVKGNAKIIRDLLTLSSALRKEEGCSGFDLLAVDKQGYSILYHLYARNLYQFTYEILSDMKPHLPLHDMQLLQQHYLTIPMSIEGTSDENSKYRVNMANLLSSLNLGGVTQAGRVPRLHPDEVSRLPRSFFQERERQLLRHVATQLYFYLKPKVEGANNDEKLVELQIMHVQFGDKNFLFVAVNHAKVSLKVANSLTRSDLNLESLLTEKYGDDAEGKARSKRYAKKLQQRVFHRLDIPESTVADKKHAEAVATILRKKNNVSPIQFNPLNLRQKLKTFMLGTDNQIYMLNVETLGYLNTRHAEEYLVDIAEILKQLGAQYGKAVYTCIAGKKRPCMGCSGRMTSVIDQFGSRPGRLWTDTIKYQSPEAARRTFKTLLTKPAHLTQTVNLAPNSDACREYDSASDSECEE